MSHIVDYKIYLDRVTIGYKTLKKTRITICALARNNEDILDRFFFKIEQLASFFKQVNVLFYENDSSDRTKHKLMDFVERANKSLEPFIGHAYLDSEHLEKKVFAGEASMERAAHMANCRNKLLFRNKVYHSDYVVMVDVDLYDWDIQGIANSFGYVYDLDWDAMTSNGLDVFRNKFIYYDTWSYMEKGKVDMEQKLSAPGFMPPVRVESGFGGLAIYKTAAIMSAQYKGLPYGSEHVGLHVNMAAKGYDKIYLNPAMITLRLDKELMKQNSKQLIEKLGV